MFFRKLFNLCVLGSKKYSFGFLFQLFYSESEMFFLKLNLTCLLWIYSNIRRSIKYSRISFESTGKVVIAKHCKSPKKVRYFLIRVLYCFKRPSAKHNWLFSYCALKAQTVSSKLAFSHLLKCAGNQSMISGVEVQNCIAVHLI